MLSRPALTDRGIARMAWRISMLQRRGLTEAQAERTADMLADRDASGDDRRLCLECKNLQRSGGCLGAQQGRIPNTLRRHEPVRDILQRCEAFEWQTPS